MHACPQGKLREVGQALKIARDITAALVAARAHPFTSLSVRLNFSRLRNRSPRQRWFGELLQVLGTPLRFILTKHL